MYVAISSSSPQLSPKVIFLSIFFILLHFLIFPIISYAKSPIRSIEGIVTKVSDGDTIQVNSQGTKLKIRLYGIDAPETEKSNKRSGHVSKPGQPNGYEAWKVLDAKIYRKKVKVDVMDIDRYKRLVSIVWLNNRNINKQMVAEGWAWHIGNILMDLCIRVHKP